MATGKKWYQAKLRDPRWNVKRMEIIKRSEGRCELCLEEKPLQIHHGYYETGIDPWEYDSDTLWALCDECHEICQDFLLVANREIGKIAPKYLYILAMILKSFRRFEYHIHHQKMEWFFADRDEGTVLNSSEISKSILDEIDARIADRTVRYRYLMENPWDAYPYEIEDLQEEE